MSENFGIHDDRRRLYGDELGIESNKYSHAIRDVWYSDNAVCDDTNFDDTDMCIMVEVLDLDNPHESDEGIEKGELHKRDRMRFANGVFKAFFDEKIIGEKVYDQLFRNLRENILKDYLGPNQEREKQLKEYLEKVAKEEELFKESLKKGAKLRSGRVLPSNSV